MKSILKRDSNKVIVQGLGRDGSFQTQKCLDFGTEVVAGVAIPAMVAEKTAVSLPSKDRSSATKKVTEALPSPSETSPAIATTPVSGALLTSADVTPLRV